MSIDLQHQASVLSEHDQHSTAASSLFDLDPSQNRNNPTDQTYRSPYDAEYFLVSIVSYNFLCSLYTSGPPGIYDFNDQSFTFHFDDIRLLRAAQRVQERPDAFAKRCESRSCTFSTHLVLSTTAWNSWLSAMPSSGHEITSKRHNDTYHPPSLPKKRHICLTKTKAQTNEMDIHAQ